eukprot:4403606-Amphidinium_carterae.1
MLPGQLAPLTYLLQLTGNTLRIGNVHQHTFYIQSSFTEANCKAHRIITAIQANGGDPVVLCGHGSAAFCIRRLFTGTFPTNHDESYDPIPGITQQHAPRRSMPSSHAQMIRQIYSDISGCKIQNCFES